MKPGITITNFLKSKEIDKQELDNNFNLVKTYEIDTQSHKGCPYCGDTVNQSRYPSGAWSTVAECIACQTIRITYISDRMGGCHVDTVYVYEQKNKPMYRLLYKCDIQKNIIECLHCGTESTDEEDIENLFCKKCDKNLKE